MSEANKAIVRRFFEEAVNQGKLEVIDEIYAPEYRNRHPHPGQKPGPAGVKELVTRIRTAFPDIQETVEHVIAEGDWVSVRLTMRGTHLGPYLGMEPTGRRVEVMGMGMVRIANGRIPEAYFFLDRPAMLEQLGVTQR